MVRFPLPEDLHEAVRVLAFKRRTHMRTIFVEAIRRYVATETEREETGK